MSKTLHKNINANISPHISPSTVYNHAADAVAIGLTYLVDAYKVKI